MWTHNHSANVCHRTEALAAECNTVRFYANAIVQNVSVRTDNRSVDYIEGFLDQTKRENK